MKTIFQKTMLMSLALMFGFAFNVSATTSTDYTPKITAKKVKDTSVTLQVVSANLKKKDVKIKVKVENKDNDSDTTTVFEKKLNKSGKVDVKVSGLTKDTEYSFKVAIKKTSDSDYSDYSDEVGVNNVGVYGYDSEIEIKDTSSSAVVLNVYSTKLKKQKVKIKVRIENKDTDKIETRIFSKTLSKNGKVEITIDNLSNNTDYSFKALVKKSKDKGYSKYSDEEDASTDE